MDDRPDRAHVRDTYERIGAHFAETRAYPWPEVEEFLDAAPTGALGLDLGCGNGRHLAPLADRTDHVVGLDASRALLDEATGRAEDDGVADRTTLVTGDAARVPLRADCVTVAVYIATLHHLPERDQRRASLDELAGVLDGDGRALVSAWSTAHDRFDADEGFDTTVEWTLPGGEVVDRFYHIYDPDEFRADLDASDLVVEEAFVSSGNCYAEVSAPE
jgi:ubiquinone/menaquinone biosynthesis C-methylase UbiE